MNKPAHWSTSPSQVAQTLYQRSLMPTHAIPSSPAHLTTTAQTQVASDISTLEPTTRRSTIHRAQTHHNCRGAIYCAQTYNVRKRISTYNPASSLSDRSYCPGRMDAYLERRLPRAIPS